MAIPITMGNFNAKGGRDAAPVADIRSRHNDASE